MFSLLWLYIDLEILIKNDQNMLITAKHDWKLAFPIIWVVFRYHYTK